METTVPSKLLTTLTHAADIVRSHDYFQVYSHYDADGVSSAAIIAQTLLRAGKEFRVTLFPTLGEREMEIVMKTRAECIIMTDLGAYFVKELDKLECDAVILDHHTLQGEPEKICYANPHLYGIDGMTSGCGATMSFLFSIAYDEKNWDLVQIAFAGIAGDRQHIKGLSGLNSYLLEGGIEKGFIEKMPGSLVPAGDLMSSLFISTDPYIRGVTGNTDGVCKLLDDAQILHGKSFMDLTPEEKTKLSSLIALRLTTQGMAVESMQEVARDRYYLKGLGMDAEELSSILNSCGRSGLGGMGIAAGMGDKKSLERGLNHHRESVKDLVTSIVNLDERGLNQMKHFQWFDNIDPGFTGMLCGIAMQSFADQNKPTIGVNRNKEHDKPANLSSRGTWVQLERGINLANAMDKACASVGGQGGGHKIAAGGSIAVDKVDEFLKNLDDVLEEQLNGAR